jgi:hypothetical protein
MQLRSGRRLTQDSRFVMVVHSIKGMWPTVRQAKSLAIKTDDIDEFKRHMHWVMQFIPPARMGRRVSRLIAFVITESLMNVWGDPNMRSQELVQKMAAMMLDKLLGTHGELGKFDIIKYTENYRRVTGL